MSERIDRRTVLKGLALAGGLPLTVRLGLAGAWGAPAPESPPAPRSLLLVVNLVGGNDGLNTVVPFTDPTYYSLRPDVALRGSEVKSLGQGFGLHGSLAFLHQQWKAGRLAVVQSVGYPDPLGSHFESARVWETASRDGRFQTGWLGRFLDETDDSRPAAVRAVSVTGGDPVTITGARNLAVSMPSLADFDFGDRTRPDSDLRRRAYTGFATGASAATMAGRVARAQATTDAVVADVQSAPDRPAPGTAAEAVAQVFAAGLGTEVGLLQLWEWDTHSNQRVLHGQRLSELDRVCKTFFGTADALGVADRANVLIVSEFGRRVPQNGSYGSDHGAASTVLAVGPQVRGGLYGTRPDLKNLSDANLVHTLDLRSVYASVIEQLLKAPSESVLGGRFPTLPLFV